MPFSPQVSPSRTRRVRGEVRKAEIIEAAASLFSEKGFNGTKTREIASSAGVSEALIFKHFPSKKDLYAAILAEESPVPRLIAQIKELSQQRKDVEVFRVIAETIVKGSPDSELMRLILFSALENHELSDMFFKNHIRVFYDILAGYIRQRIKEKAFRQVSPLIAARGFMGMLIYHRLLTILFGAHLPNNPKEIAETFVSIMMGGVQTSGPPKRDGSSGGLKPARKRKRLP